MAHKEWLSVLNPSCHLIFDCSVISPLVGVFCSFRLNGDFTSQFFGTELIFILK